MTRFDRAERIADAVLYEGYVLYPYRATAAKNRYRWQFGVIAPRAPHEDAEPWCAQTECLIEMHAADSPATGPPATVCVRARFLRPRAGRGGTGARVWLEGFPQAADAGPFEISGGPARCSSRLPDGDLDAWLVVEWERLSASHTKLRVRLENRERWQDCFDRDRDAMLCRSLAGAHLLVAVEGGAFVSLLQPPDEAAGLAASCRNLHSWPVLVGDRARRDLLLASPIILYDFPAIAEESPGDLYDATEIDEMLTLRVLTMTEQEKREARLTDPRARAVIDRIEALAPDDIERLHGALRASAFFDPPGTPAPRDATIDIGGARVGRGAKVRLQPSGRADAMDMFLRGQVATVSGVYQDVDARTYVAVTVDADPAASFHESFGRFFYFDPAEIEPLNRDGEGEPRGGSGPEGSECCDVAARVAEARRGEREEDRR